MEAPSLREKLLKSRSLWHRTSDAGFLVDLYETLDSPDTEDIMTWSEDGKVILIDKSHEIEERLLMYFENCQTTSKFFEKFSKHQFVRIVDNKYNAEYAFKHSCYSRDNRPEFESWSEIKAKKSRRKLKQCKKQQAAESTEGDNSKSLKKIKISQTQGITYRPIHWQSLDESQRSLLELLTQQENYDLFRGFHSFNMLIQKFFMQIKLQQQMEQLLD